MTKVTVLSIRPESMLLNTTPYWCDPKLNTYINQEKVNETQAKVSNLTFPCEMTDTGEKNLFNKRILIDDFGNKWSETHFIVKKEQG